MRTLFLALTLLLPAPGGQSTDSSQPQTKPPVKSVTPRDKRTRAERREEVLNEVSKSRWTFVETAHYFLVSAVSEPEFVDELRSRCESIRKRIAEDFPLAEAGPAAVLTAPVVIRVCKDREQFSNYGGSPESGGYWDSLTRECVIYDAKADGGRGDTWAMLNGMVLLAHLDEICDAKPAPWFVYGHCDYYSGFQLERASYRAAPFAWRQRSIQEAIRVQRQRTLDSNPSACTRR